MDGDHNPANAKHIDCPLCRLFPEHGYSDSGVHSHNTAHNAAFDLETTPPNAKNDRTPTQDERRANQICRRPH